ncbi:hypothetical protein PR048_012171 [Dryococelus australis]|uniref:Uncharacterized protein n=1 Tax=Dryococelus australis TaxID=614101 RepID=A0ABQ9HNV0_9NEOP|nr:hypothetical protein PR048_012171 [Dryococelus australis]
MEKRRRLQYVQFCDHKTDFKCVYTEVTFAIASEFIRHALDDSAPIADLQGNKKRIPYCQMWGNTGATANNNTSEVRLYKGMWSLAYSGETKRFGARCSRPAHGNQVLNYCRYHLKADLKVKRGKYQPCHDGHNELSCRFKGDYRAGATTRLNTPNHGNARHTTNKIAPGDNFPRSRAWARNGQHKQKRSGGSFDEGIPIPDQLCWTLYSKKYNSWQQKLVLPKLKHHPNVHSEVKRMKRFGWLLTARSSEPMSAIEVRMEWYRIEVVEETGDPRENPPTSGIVRHDSHVRKSGSDSAGLCASSMLEIIATTRRFPNTCVNIVVVRVCVSRGRTGVFENKYSMICFAPGRGQSPLPTRQSRCSRQANRRQQQRPSSNAETPSHTVAASSSPQLWGRGCLVVRLPTRLPPRRTGVDSRIFALWLAGFLGDLRFLRPCIPSLLHTHFTSTSPNLKSLDVKSHPNVSLLHSTSVHPHALDEYTPIADRQRNKKRIPYCQMWVNTCATANEHTSEVRLYKGLRSLAYRSLNSRNFPIPIYSQFTVPRWIIAPDLDVRRDVLSHASLSLGDPVFSSAVWRARIDDKGSSQICKSSNAFMCLIILRCPLNGSGWNYSPPAKESWVRFLEGSPPEFRTWESCLPHVFPRVLSGISRFPPTLHSPSLALKTSMLRASSSRPRSRDALIVDVALTTSRHSYLASYIGLGGGGCTLRSPFIVAGSGSIDVFFWQQEVRSKCIVHVTLTRRVRPPSVRHNSGGGNGRYPRKPADQRHRPTRFPHAKIRERPGRGLNPWWEASRLTAQPPRSPGFSQVVIVPDDAVSRRVFSGISRFPAPSFRCRSLFTSITLIGSQDLAVKSGMDSGIFCEILFARIRPYDGNTASLVRRSNEALEVRVSVARIAPSLLDLGRASPSHS